MPKSYKLAYLYKNKKNKTKQMETKIQKAKNHFAKQTCLKSRTSEEGRLIGML